MNAKPALRWVIGGGCPASEEIRILGWWLAAYGMALVGVSYATGSYFAAITLAETAARIVAAGLAMAGAGVVIGLMEMRTDV